MESTWIGRDLSFSDFRMSIWIGDVHSGTEQALAWVHTGGQSGNWLKYAQVERKCRKPRLV
jgi:hypothetical protein